MRPPAWSLSRKAIGLENGPKRAKNADSGLISLEKKIKS